VAKPGTTWWGANRKPDWLLAKASDEVILREAKDQLFCNKKQLAAAGFATLSMTDAFSAAR
jgi:hypothetical protein